MNRIYKKCMLALSALLILQNPAHAGWLDYFSFFTPSNICGLVSKGQATWYAKLACVATAATAFLGYKWWQSSRSNSRLEKKNTSLKKSLVDTKQTVLDTEDTCRLTQDASNQEIEILKSQHAAEISHLKNQHQEEIKRLKKEHKQWQDIQAQHELIRRTYYEEQAADDNIMNLLNDLKKTSEQKQNGASRE